MPSRYFAQTRVDLAAKFKRLAEVESYYSVAGEESILLHFDRGFSLRS
jgi:hypothetical protein